MEGSGVPECCMGGHSPNTQTMTSVRNKLSMPLKPQGVGDGPFWWSTYPNSVGEEVLRGKVAACT